MAEDCYSMPAEKYLAKHNILVYLEDAVSQLLEHKDENSKVNPIKFLSDYFSSVRDGNHTMFRDYAFIHSTSHNRASFVRLFWKCYRQIGKKGDLLSSQEYHSLLGLICPDFPFPMVKKIARIILIDDALDCLISFSDFVYAFQVQLYYDEFLERCSAIYQSLLQSFRSPRDPVVVPTSGGSEDSKIHLTNSHPSEDVDSMQFFRAIYPLCDKIEYSSPPISALKEILFHVQRISFYGFLISIAKNEAINSHIGHLPSKVDLLEGGDTELTSDMSITTKLQKMPQSHPSSETTLIRPTMPARSKSALGITKPPRKPPPPLESPSSESDTESDTTDSY